MPGEFRIIRDYFQRAYRDDALVLGIGDDGAVLRPREGRDLVVVTDTINAGRHFPDTLPPDDIGWRALAVNLSDVAAMGATPRFAFLNLSLPEADPDWLQSFAAGFFELADQSGTRLAGGDTTQGPLSVTVTIIAEVPTDGAITRNGARAGDVICVSGTPGEAGAGLERLQSNIALDDPLVRRFRRPLPRLVLGNALRGLATAMIDVSDGLLADLGHILAASGVGARLSIDRLPRSAALAAHAERPEDYVLAGGDDYELCFTVPAERIDEALSLAQADCRVSMIGEVTAERDVRVLDADGGEWQPRRRGWEHFSGTHDHED